MNSENDSFDEELYMTENGALRMLLKVLYGEFFMSEVGKDEFWKKCYELKNLE